MSDILKDQFIAEWLMHWEGRTNNIRIRDINSAKELLEYLDNAKDMNYKKMYSRIIYYGWTNWPTGYRDECCEYANEEFHVKLNRAINNYNDDVDVNEFVLIYDKTIPKMSILQKEIPNEILCYIFKYNRDLLNTMLTCKKFNNIIDHQFKADWIIYHYGKLHVLFYAIILPKFIDMKTVKSIVKKGGIISRYFMQKLLIAFGKEDSVLHEQKLIGNPDMKKEINWCNDLSVSIFCYLLDEAMKLYDNDLYLKGNDMELFHFLTGGPHFIKTAFDIIEKNFKEIERLIKEFKFAPFPSRPKKLSLPFPGPDGSLMIRQEAYPSLDGYENNRQLNVIARGILLDLRFAKIWKEIGYFNMCQDLNGLVLQGATLILFPPTNDLWNNSKEAIVKRFKELIDLGFELNDKIIYDIFNPYIKKLDRIGGIFLNSFIERWAKIAIPVLWQNPFKYYKHNDKLDSLRKVICHDLDVKEYFRILKKEDSISFSYLSYVRKINTY
ncbi:5063_t:CDS:2 [Scutellospora calospora]|uniref:5063_t:CDS:1 n=1 Tax=Scutellospora calospora TaxID=85575 RepID=A0ACA9KCI8_9GLOM|nr:5063_t:CDS:2 [Scutellospora calospora]